ncbi:MAG: 4Fe-4S dicluster domain-containing protein [Thermincola sp.]|nr:4Fe-4S dicluster domain-containing protein [Thermincola sp.]MDT3704947.1 4Fe-4S dicluster domain-containing protein [Thermincola sp.]
MSARGNYDELDIKSLKVNGFLQQVQPDRFSLRIKVVGGQLTAEKLQAVSKAAEKYGDGTVHFTARQSVEIPHIKSENIGLVKQFLLENGLEPGILGPRVRTITACHGNAVCKHGKIRTTELAYRLGEATRGIDLPHKFKIGITGCCNNCLKAEENDLGIKGGVLPNWQSENCTFCGACVKNCPAKSIKLDKHARELNIKDNSCINCGRCVSKCARGAMGGTPGYILYFGGVFGNQILTGQKILPIILTADEVEKIVLLVLEFYCINGKTNERFGLMLKRIGMEKLAQVLKEKSKYDRERLDEHPKTCEYHMA